MVSDTRKGARRRPAIRSTTIQSRLSRTLKILVPAVLAGACISAVVLPLPGTVADAQPAWSPQGRISVFVDIAGRNVSVSTIDTSCHPWVPGANFTERFACRYAGGKPYDVIKGHNPQGFANELFYLNKLALEKLGFVNPSEELQMDWAVSHPRSCQAYGLTYQDGCGGPGGDGGGSGEEGLPRRLVDYCKEWGWSAPGHLGPSNAACKAYRGCDRSACPCFDERRATTASGGSWVFFDPTVPSCRPDRTFDGGGGGGDGGGGDGGTGDGGTGDGGDGGADGGADGGGSGTRTACDQALEKLEQALKEAQRVCPVGG